MLTALLIDGTDSPICVRVDNRTDFFWWGVPGEKPRKFKFVRFEGVNSSVLVYRIISREISDELFEACAAAEADKHVHPEKYRHINKGIISASPSRLASARVPESAI